MILGDFVHDAPAPDPLGGPHLLFTSCLDGDLEPWLRALAALPGAQAVWAHCAGAPAPGDVDGLVGCLRPAGSHGLLRRRLRRGDGRARAGRAGPARAQIALAVDAQAMTPGELRAAIAGAAVIELADVQGDILRAYGNRYRWTTYLLVAVARRRGRPRLARRPARSRAPRRGTATGREATRNVALSAAGLRALGFREAALATFSSEFRAGMLARAGALGDTGRARRSAGTPGCAARSPRSSPSTRAARRRWTRAVAAELAALGAGVELVHREDARLLGGPGQPVREHFGFADGFSQPAVEGIADAERTNGGGVPLAGGGWRPLAPGEFVLGYPRRGHARGPEARLPRAPAAPYGRNGSYVVFRKLRQDVARFRRTLGDRGGAVARRRRRHARRQGRRAPAGRPPARRGAGPRLQRLPLRRGRPARARLPARRAHPPREPARRARRGRAAQRSATA